MADGKKNAACHMRSMVCTHSIHLLYTIDYKQTQELVLVGQRGKGKTEEKCLEVYVYGKKNCVVWLCVCKNTSVWFHFTVLLLDWLLVLLGYFKRREYMLYEDTLQVYLSSYINSHVMYYHLCSTKVTGEMWKILRIVNKPTVYICFDIVKIKNPLFHWESTRLLH